MESRSLEDILQGLETGDSDSVSEELMTQIQAALSVDTITDLPEVTTKEPESDNHSEDIRQTISKANLPQKVKLAMFGNSVARGLLIRDANRMIQEFVLKNPRIQLKEIEDFSRNPNIAQNVLRNIAGNQQWMRSYAVKASLVTNPKTPADVALKWLRYLNMSDLKKLARSKNVPQVISVMAKKKVDEVEKGR